MVAASARGVRASLAFCCMLFSGPAPLAAQRVLTVTDRVACPSCGIDLSHRVDLTPPPDGLPGFPADLAMDGRGRIYLGFGSPAEIVRFTPSGRYEVGWRRPGEGPGELRVLRYLQVIEGDSLLTFDPVLRRANVYTPAGAFARSFRSPAGISRPIQVADGRLVFNELVSEPGRSGLPLHESSRTGILGRSFGSRVPDVGATETFRLKHLSAPARMPGAASQFWSVSTSGSYVIELREIGVPEPMLTLVREASWFPSQSEDAMGPPSFDRPPRPQIWGIWQDTTGLVWVLVRVADPRWRSAIAAGSTAQERGAPPNRTASLQVTDPGRYTDFRFDVIDPVRGQLVATRQVDEAFSIGSTPGVLIGYAAESDPDDPIWTIIMPRLIGPRDR